MTPHQDPAIPALPEPEYLGYDNDEGRIYAHRPREMQFHGLACYEAGYAAGRAAGVQGEAVDFEAAKEMLLRSEGILRRDAHSEEADAVWEAWQRVCGITPITAPTIPQAAEVPGFVLVPREPTEAMLETGLRAAEKEQFSFRGKVLQYDTPQWALLKVAYAAMIQAAPTPTASIAAKAEADDWVAYVNNDGFLIERETGFALAEGVKLYMRHLRAESLPAGVDEALQRLIENAATMGPASRDDALLVAKHRAALAAPKAEGEAVGEIVLFGGDLKEVSWRKGQMPAVGTKLYAAPVAQAAVGASMLREAAQQALNTFSTLCSYTDSADLGPTVIEEIGDTCDQLRAALTIPRPEAPAVAPVAGEVKS